MPTMEQASMWLAGRLLAGSVQGALVVGVVWVVCWRIRSIPPSARAALWWLASLKLVLMLHPVPSIPLAVLPPVSQSDPAPPVDAYVVNEPLLAEPAASELPIAAPAPAPSGPREWDWTFILVACWTAGVALHAARLFAGWRRVRGVTARSTPVSEDEAALAARLATAVGLGTPPDIRVSEEIDSPQVVGVRRPVVLLPAGISASFTPDERAMAICHELVHVRRRDLLFGWVPACAERLFFFHPLARLAAREYAVAREAACDAVVVELLGVAPREYGRVLLRLGVGGWDAALSAAGASTSRSSLKRRLDMLQHIARGRSRRLVWAAAGFIALLVVPVHLVARVEPSAPAVPGAETAVTDGTAVAVLGTALNADAQAPSESQDRAEARRLKELEKQRDAVQKAVEKAQKAATHEFLQKEIDTALAEREYEKAKLQASTVDAKAIEEKIQAAFRAAAERLAQAQAAQPASQGRQQSSQKSQPPSQGVQPSSQGSQQASQEAIERQKATIDQMAAQIRELERALRQATLDSQVRADTAQAAAVNAQAAALARSQEASRRQAEQRAAVQRRLSEQGAQPGSAPVTAANSERQTVLDAQLAELARTQKIVSDQLQNLARQQETMRDAQMRLTESLENLRRSLERIEGTRTTTPAQPAKK